jgi:hypothetical protein
MKLLEKIKLFLKIRKWEKNHHDLKFCKNCNGNGKILVKKLIREAKIEKRNYYTGGCAGTCDGSGSGYYGCSGECSPHLVESFIETEPAIYQDIIESCKHCNGLGGIPKGKKEEQLAYTVSF